MTAALGLDFCQDHIPPSVFIKYSLLCDAWRGEMLASVDRVGVTLSLTSGEEGVILLCKTLRNRLMRQDRSEWVRYGVMTGLDIVSAVLLKPCRSRDQGFSWSKWKRFRSNSCLNSSLVISKPVLPKSLVFLAINVWRFIKMLVSLLVYRIKPVHLALQMGRYEHSRDWDLRLTGSVRLCAVRFWN